MNGWIVVKQFLLGQWVELIRLPAEKKLNAEEIEESLKVMKDLIFDHDKVNISTENSVVIFDRNDGPVKLDYIVEVEPPSGVDMPN